MIFTTLVALWRILKKFKALFRKSKTVNKVLVSTLSTLAFCLQFRPSHCTHPLFSAPLSPATGLVINPSSNSSSLSNSAAKGLAGAHVSLPYQLWAGSMQSCRILPSCPCNRLGSKSTYYLPLLHSSPPALCIACA